MLYSSRQSCLDKCFMGGKILITKRIAKLTIIFNWLITSIGMSTKLLSKGIFKSIERGKSHHREWRWALHLFLWIPTLPDFVSRWLVPPCRYQLPYSCHKTCIPKQMVLQSPVVVCSCRRKQHFLLCGMLKGLLFKICGQNSSI